MRAILHTLAARIRALVTPRPAEREFDDELAAHLAMAEEDKVRAGMDPAEARRTARADLGGLTQVREAGRAARGIPWLGSFALDIKLGLRMLRKTWGLTLVGGAAMTVTIGIGATVFAALDTLEDGGLPFDNGDRIVAIQPYDPVDRTDYDSSLENFEYWRAQLSSFEQLGAFDTIQPAMVTPNGSAGTVTLARMTVSAFQIPGIDPVLGRSLLPEDEEDDAAPVIVIGHGLWASQFSSDPGVLGQVLDLDGIAHTIVGVMPEGYRFPVNHDAWEPLHTDRTDIEAVFVIARLAPDVSIERARAEVSAAGLIPDASAGDQTSSLQTRVVPYASTFNDDLRDNPWIIRLILAVVMLLLVPPAANIAILLYARNVTRRDEFEARYVLGAGRGRIVAQLFVEALMLALVAGVVALLATQQALVTVERIATQEIGAGLPYWLQFGVSLETVGFVALLALMTAAISGALPALWATARMRQPGFHALGSHSGMRLGKTWTGLVAFQVALSMAALPIAGQVMWEGFKASLIGPGFESREFLSAGVAMTGERPGNTRDASNARRFVDLQADLVRQLEAGPAPGGVTLTQYQPGLGPQRNMESDPNADGGPRLIRTAFDRIDAAFFDVFDLALLAGRRFDAGDFQSGGTGVIVNRSFVDNHLDGENALGRRFRTPAGAKTEPGPWYEIIGIVEDLSPNETQATMYHAMPPGQVHPVTLSFHAGTPIPDDIGARLREVTTAMDSSLRVGTVRSIHEILGEIRAVRNMVGASIMTGLMIVLLFTLAGVNTLMAFTVSRSRREIGIRAALGAQRWRLLASVFRQGLVPVAVGATIGWLIALALDIVLSRDHISVYALGGSAVFMILLGALSLAGPARRVTKIAPTTALRDG